MLLLIQARGSARCAGARDKNRLINRIVTAPHAGAVSAVIFCYPILPFEVHLIGLRLLLLLVVLLLALLFVVIRRWLTRTAAGSRDGTENRRRQRADSRSLAGIAGDCTASRTQSGARRRITDETATLKKPAVAYAEEPAIPGLRPLVITVPLIWWR